MGNTSFSDTTTASNSGRIIIHTNKTAYLPGDNISGKIYIHTFSPQPPCTLFLNLHGIEASYIFYDVDSRPDKAEREIVNTTWTLYRWESGLSVEHIEIPFSFQLPDSLPPSFHQEGPAFIAHITYKLEAFIKEDGVKEGSKTISRVQKFAIRSPNKKTPSSYTQEKKVQLTTLGCIPQGSLTLKAHFEKDVYSPGEEARLAIEVDSLHSKLDNKEICFQLTQKIKLNYKFGGKRIYTSIAKSSIPGAEARGGSVIKSLVLSVPAFVGDYHNYDKRIDKKDREVMPFRAGTGLGLTTKGKIISSEFYLEVYCNMKGHGAKIPKIKCPIEICYPDPQKQPLHLPGNWNPEVLPMFEGTIKN